MTHQLPRRTLLLGPALVMAVMIGVGACHFFEPHYRTKVTVDSMTPPPPPPPTNSPANTTK